MYGEGERGRKMRNDERRKKAREQGKAKKRK